MYKILVFFLIFSTYAHIHRISQSEAGSPIFLFFLLFFFRKKRIP